MRLILDTLKQLQESVGLANRQPGTSFKNPAGDELFFQSVDFYPDGGGEYKDTDEMLAAVDLLSSKIGIQPTDIEWMNTSTAQSRAFGLAHFVDAENKDVYMGRYMQKISPIKVQNSFPNVGLPGGYRLQTAVAQKEAAGYKPTDVLTKLDDLRPEEVAQQIVTKFGEDSDEARAVAIFMAEDFPMNIPQGDMIYTAFTNYFCELLQPMALVMGKKLGNEADARKAESEFLSEGGFSSCTISYGATKTGGLTDSVLINSAGQTMGVSSKAEGGAKASAKNLKDKIVEMQRSPEGKQVLERHKEAVSVIETVTEGSTPGPLNMGVIAGIITPEEKDQILAIKNVPPGEEVLGNGRLSDKLEDMYRGRKARDPSVVIPFFHIRAVIANMVAKYVNENTDFSEAAAEILNWGAFIQLNTTGSSANGEIKLNPFDTIYPSKAITSVQLSADKTFYSTGSKGNFVFKIGLNGGTVPDDDTEVTKVDTKPDVDITKQRSDIKASPTASSEPLDDKALGRKRRNES
jgi:hypothetical protein